MWSLMMVLGGTIALRTSILPSLLALGCLEGAQATKDSSYYPAGAYNPNVNKTMYWHDAYNVLQDLDKFRVLYIKFSNCIWSEVTDEDGENQYDGEENDYWYMGSVPSFRANAAFTLYGVLHGEKDVGCTRKTYINSFFTTTGIQSYTDTLAYANVEGFSRSNGDDHQRDGNQREGQDDDVTTAMLDTECYSGNDGYSYAVTCSNRDFVVGQFDHDYCDGNHLLSQSDDLASFNERIQDSGCVAIFRNETYENIEDNQEADREGNRDHEDEDDNMYEALALLTYSKACSVRDQYRTCPDPYGKLSAYTSRLECSTGASTDSCMTIRAKLHKHRKAIGWFMRSAGVLMFLLGVAMFIEVTFQERIASRKLFMKKMVDGIFRRRQSDSRSYDQSPSMVSSSPTSGSTSYAGDSLSYIKSESDSLTKDPLPAGRATIFGSLFSFFQTPRPPTTAESAAQKRPVIHAVLLNQENDRGVIQAPFVARQEQPLRVLSAYAL